MREQYDVIKMLQDMVRIDSCQPEGNEKQLINLIRDFFAPYSEDIVLTEIEHSENRSSLVIRIGPEVEGGLAFVGHLDTVSVGDRNKWAYDPHSAKLVEDTVYGRGAVDMKAGVAAMTVAALDYLKAGIKFEKPLYLIYTADEENGCQGARVIAESKLLGSAAAFVIPEPTDNKPAIAEKGLLWLRFHLEGQLAHGSKPEAGINAVEAAVDLSKLIKETVSVNLKHPLLGNLTLSVNRLEGGIMTNIIPAEALIEMDIRTQPEQNHDDLLELIDSCMNEVLEGYPGLVIRLEIIHNYPSLSSDENSDFIKRVQKYVREEGLPDNLCGMTYLTDAAALIPVHHKPFVIIGPGHESMAHQQNEAVKVASVHQALQIYKKIMKDLT